MENKFFKALGIFSKPKHIYSFEEGVPELSLNKSKLYIPTVLATCALIVYMVCNINKINTHDPITTIIKVAFLVLMLYVFKESFKMELTKNRAYIYFFEDFLVFYVPEIAYNKNKSSEQFAKINYENIKVEYRRKKKLLTLSGEGETVMFHTIKGVKSKTPEHMDLTNGLVEINTTYMGETFFKEIEENSPIRILNL